VTKIVAVAIGLFATLVTAQTAKAQHAPTVYVCRADRALWFNLEDATEYLKAEKEHVSNGTRNRTAIAKLGIDEIIARETEMLDCSRVDSDRLGLYQKAITFYSDVVCQRKDNFIHRHHLMDQLKREDAQGLR